MTAHVMTTESGARLALVSCALRNTGTGWHVITDSGHDPSNVTAVVQDTGYLEIQHAVGAVKVISMLVTVDETYAKSGLRCGASAGLSLSRIYLYSGATGTAAVDPATISATNGNLWVSGYLLLPNSP